MRIRDDRSMTRFSAPGRSRWSGPGAARALAVGVALAAGLTLTGCVASTPTSGPTSASPTRSASATPQTTPKPTSTAQAGLTISQAGLGPLVLGTPVDESGAAGKLVTWTPGCSVNEPDVARWTATVPDPDKGLDADGHSSPAFDIVTSARTAPLELVEVLSSAIPSDTGIHVGSSRSELQKAYPSGFSTSIAGPLSDLYLVTGSTGTLGYEVINSGSDAAEIYPDRADTVAIITAFASSFPLSGIVPIAGGETRGGCD
jgi:hypothetical protein